MNTPQDRVIKKMIDNIVETNRPVFEKPVTGTQTSSATTSSSQSAAPQLITEDYAMITRKLDYGFNNLRQENAELRKQLDELGGGMKLIRGDLENIRSMINQRASAHSAPAAAPRRQESAEDAPRSAGSSGAPQYRESEADAAYHRDSNGSSHHSEEQPQARGTQKKDDTTIDISKVFYYGKK